MDRAQLAVQVGEYDLALKQLSAAEKFESSAEERRGEREYLQARSYEGLGRAAEAIRHYEAVSAGFSGSPYAYLAGIKLAYLRSDGKNSAQPSAEEPVTEAHRSLSNQRQDTDAAAFRDYLDEVKKKVLARWNYPCLKVSGGVDCDFKDAELIVELNIDRSGTVSLTKVLRRSGIDVYDFSAIEAIVLAAPFAPLPPDAFPGKDVARLLLHMQYHDNRK